MNIFDQIEKPTLLLKPEVVQQNIRRMVQKMQAHKVRFRPHFKTHQSAMVGDWFRQQDVTAITVSSLDMANYFADSGWQDILVAFSLNIRQAALIRQLAGRIHLGVLVESVEVVDFLASQISDPVDAWIKIDTGGHRTGISLADCDQITRLGERILSTPHLKLRGVLTHAGQTYAATKPVEVCTIFRQSVDSLVQLRETLKSKLGSLEISVGDTPGCTLCDDLSGVDEVRPGNFVFFDVMQLNLGVCSWEDIAVSLACPVVAKHAQRREVVIYGGAVHLSKESMMLDGKRCYGMVGLPTRSGWGEPLAGVVVDRLSQEHGVIHVDDGSEFFKQIQVGDLICVYPVHSCLTANLMKKYLTMEGEWIRMMDAPDR